MVADRDIARRRFLGLGAAAATAGLPGLAAAARGEQAAADGPPRVRRYVPLGNTGLVVSDVSFGSASSADPDLVRYAFERGVTLFDSAESYRFGYAEEAIGEALQGHRDEVVLTSKTKAWASETRADMMKALEESLRRLRTDHVDIYFNHSVNDVDRLKNEEWAAFTEQAKAQGKIRFRGVSGHGSRLVECLDYTLDHDLADVILAAYNFGQDPDFYSRLRDAVSFPAVQPELPRVLDKAQAKEVGVIAMKTLMGARRNDMREHEWEGATFAQAAFRWVLASPRVDALVISMNGRDEIDEYLGGSGEPEVRGEELRLLARYAYLQHGRYCRPGCDGCAEACPAGVAIAEVLRTRMYEVDYGDRELALGDYRKLAADGLGDAAACLSCAHQACAAACPFDLAIPDLTRDAARRLG